jgi:hypothetical protein
MPAGAENQNGFELRVCDLTPHRLPEQPFVPFIKPLWSPWMSLEIFSQPCEERGKGAGEKLFQDSTVLSKMI